MNVDITALVGMKHPMSNFLDLLLFFCNLLEFILLYLVVVVFLQNSVGTWIGVK